MTIGLKELAAQLGLSMTTVSRALNGFPEVGAATRARVQAAASAAGYRANVTARRLATGRANAFGIVFSSERDVLESPIVTDFLSGVGDVSAERGIDLILCPTRPGEETASCNRLIAGGTVDALIVFANILLEDGMAALVATGFPVVVHGRPQEGIAVPSLSVDNHAAFHGAAGHLLALGHRRLGLLNGDETQTYAIDRRAGFLAALEEAGLEADPGLLSSGPQTFVQGLAAARAMLARAERPTGLVCSSVLMALGALKAAGEAGLGVPDDLSVVAFDDEVRALPPDMATPSLTTVHSPIRAAGAQVAAMALEAVAGTGPAERTQIWTASLVQRGSTAPPPA